MQGQTTKENTNTKPENVETIKLKSELSKTLLELDNALLSRQITDKLDEATAYRKYNFKGVKAGMFFHAPYGFTDIYELFAEGLTISAEKSL